MDIKKNTDWIILSFVLGFFLGILFIQVLSSVSDNKKSIDPNFCFGQGYGFIGYDSRGVYCETASGPGVYYNDDEITLFTYEEYDGWLLLSDKKIK